MSKEVQIIDMWATDYDDIRCLAVLKENDREIAEVVASYDENDIRYAKGYEDSFDIELTDDFVKEAFEELITDAFEEYANLPKISKCSKLLQYIHDEVVVSEATMCHIDYTDWKELEEEYEFTDKDIDVLREEIEKYELEDVVTIDADGYKICGYGDLETRFNMDTSLENYKEQEEELEL